MYFGRCNLTTCRYNVEHYCTDKDHRHECLSVKRNKAYSLIKGNKEVLDKVIDEGEKISLTHKQACEVEQSKDVRPNSE